jgi:hypothetical protein
VAYAVAAVGTMLWVACVIPAGALQDPALLEDWSTPMHRAAILIVPALLLLIAGPVGVTLSRGAVGKRGVLAATDTFVCLYAAVAVAVEGAGTSLTYWTLAALMLFLGVLSLVEVLRYARAAARGAPAPRVAGVRLAVALLVLLMPSWFLVEDGRELASLLVPFAFVAVSAGGARLARTSQGLRLTAGILHTAMAAHLLVTLRYQLFDAEPRFSSVAPPGFAVLGASAVLLLLAIAHVGVLLRTSPANA